MRYYLVTYYIKNNDVATKDIFEYIPSKSEELTMTHDQLMKLINSKFQQFPYLRCVTVMEKLWKSHKDYDLKFTAKNLYYSETPATKDYNLEDFENRDMKKYANEAFFSKYEVNHKGFEINLEKEEKVICLGAYFYILKGVLICEASEDEKEKYDCDKYMVYPIVDDDWLVYEGDEICDNIESLIIGKKGDTLLLKDLQVAINYSVRENICEYECLLLDVERCGITVSNRKSLDSNEELSDTIVLEISNIGNNHFSIKSNRDSYYIAERYFIVGKDDELYESNDDYNLNQYHKTIVSRIVDDVYGLSYFFNKPNLRVLVTARVLKDERNHEYEYVTIPKDWFYTVQTLESEINRELDELHKQYPNSYNKKKRPDVFEEKK